ncbi:MAG: hypothetical protein HRT99_00685 [Mycoplasmatales bacterium]|nr:hypothetical protein [Mycoplasmatales bacterium]
MNHIIDEVHKIAYSYDDVCEIRIIGDWARWSKRLAKGLGATYYIDKFHVHKALKDLVGKDNYHEGLKNITNDKLTKHIVRHQLLKLIANSFTGEIKPEDLKKLGYIINNI